jgi:hypothetical protein
VNKRKAHEKKFVKGAEFLISKDLPVASACEKKEENYTVGIRNLTRVELLGSEV